MTLPSAGNLPNYPFPANAREYDFEFIRMMMQASGIVEGVCPSTPGTSPMADMLVTTGASGLNVSVAAGRAFVQGDSRSTQGLYFVYAPAATTVTLPAAHATLPRIDAVVCEVLDADVSGATTKWQMTYQQGTATASANIDPTSANFLLGGPGQSGGPALQANSFVVAYVLTPALFAGPYVNATHIFDYRTHYLNKPMRYISGASSTTSGSYVNMGTNPDIDYLVLNVPANALVRLWCILHAKILVVGGTQYLGFFFNNVQVKKAALGAVPAVMDSFASSLPATANIYKHLALQDYGTFTSDGSGAADVSDVTTGQVYASAINQQHSPMQVFGLAAGKYVVDLRAKTTASTMSIRERRLWADVIPFN